MGQELTSIGEWESHLPHQQGRWVTQDDDDIIYATEWSLFLIDKSDLSVRYLSKVNGLSDTGIETIHFDPITMTLIVAYTNSNIDFINEEGTRLVSDLRTNTVVQGDRRVNHIHTDSQGFVYLSTAFGIVIYDLNREEFDATIFTELSIASMTSSNRYLLAATDEGVFRFDLLSDLNIQDFNNWQLLGQNEGLPTLEPVRHVSFFNGELYVATTEALYVEDDANKFQLINQVGNNEKIAFLSPNSDYLMVGIQQSNTPNSRTLFIDTFGNQIATDSECSNFLRYGVVDETGRVWFADEWEQVRFSDNLESGCNRITYDGPRSHNASDISLRDGVAYVASGGVSETFAYLFDRSGFYIGNANGWENINQDNLPFLRDQDILNMYSVAIHPREDKLYVGSYWAGLLEYDLIEKNTTLYDKDNSSLEGAVGDIARTRISGLAFDQDNNLWISNFLASKPLSVFTAEGQWHSFSSSTSNTNFEELVIDNSGLKWIVVAGTSSGVFVFDDNGTIADPTDDRKLFLTLNNSQIPTSQVYSVAVDLSGDVWVGTAEGPVRFDCGEGVFSDDVNCRGDRLIVLQDSIPAILLETEEIRTIAVDGANRKWFGTRRGIFVQSPDGQTQIARYTEEDSPLFDNTINKLAFDGSTGKMFVSTNKGLQAIRTTTTAGSRTHNESNVYAFPNPVRPGYEGTIAIRGLVTDATVKITDVNGRLVHEGVAEGGQFVWDGTDYSGNRPATGTYLVWSTGALDFEAQDSYVAKILIIN